MSASEVEKILDSWSQALRDLHDAPTDTPSTYVQQGDHFSFSVPGDSRLPSTGTAVPAADDAVDPLKVSAE